jgi:hypothetical protein
MVFLAKCNLARQAIETNWIENSKVDEKYLENCRLIVWLKRLMPQKYHFKYWH